VNFDGGCPVVRGVPYGTHPAAPLRQYLGAAFGAGSDLMNINNISHLNIFGAPLVRGLVRSLKNPWCGPVDE